MSEELTITYANSATGRLFGASPKKLVGSSYASLVDSSQLDDVRAKVGRVVGEKSREVLNHRRLCRRRDGSTFYGHITGSALFDATNTVIGIVVVLVDISNNLQKESKINLLAGVFKHSQESIVITSVNGIPVDVNDSFTKTTGYSKNDVVGLPPRMLRSHYQDAEFYETITKEILRIHGDKRRKGPGEEPREPHLLRPPDEPTKPYAPHGESRGTHRDVTRLQKKPSPSSLSISTTEMRCCASTARSPPTSSSSWSPTT